MCKREVFDLLGKMGDIEIKRMRSKFYRFIQKINQEEEKRMYLWKKRKRISE